MENEQRAKVLFNILTDLCKIKPLHSIVKPGTLLAKEKEIILFIFHLLFPFV